MGRRQARIGKIGGRDWEGGKQGWRRRKPRMLEGGKKGCGRKGRGRRIEGMRKAGGRYWEGGEKVIVERLRRYTQTEE